MGIESMAPLWLSGGKLVEKMSIAVDGPWNFHLYFGTYQGFSIGRKSMKVTRVASVNGSLRSEYNSIGIRTNI